MERTLKISIALPVFAVVIIAGTCCAATRISVTGSWLETLDQAHLTGGPGSDFPSAVESASDQATIEVDGAGNRDWRVDIRKVDGNWHVALSLHVRRTSDGSGPGDISGGTSYQEVTDTYQGFFSGSKNRNGIDIQMRLGGVSVQVPGDAYTTSLYYTVVDTY